MNNLWRVMCVMVRVLLFINLHNLELQEFFVAIEINDRNLDSLKSLLRKWESIMNKNRATEVH